MYTSMLGPDTLLKVVNLEHEARIREIARSNLGREGHARASHRGRVEQRYQRLAKAGTAFVRNVVMHPVHHLGPMPRHL